MTTAQLTGKINLDLPGRPAGPVGGRGAALAGAVKYGAAGLDRFSERLAGWLERGDTRVDRLAGHGLCGLTLAYLCVQLARAFL